jgi:hypothetical protein
MNFTKHRLNISSIKHSKENGTNENNESAGNTVNMITSSSN